METLDFGSEVPKAGSFEIIEEKPEERPPCPECGTKNPIRTGISWRCRDCGKHWTREPHPRKYNYSDRPPCPECGSNKKIISKGDAWYCGSCGRTWRKIKRKPVAR